MTSYWPVLVFFCVCVCPRLFLHRENYQRYKIEEPRWWLLVIHGVFALHTVYPFHLREKNFSHTTIELPYTLQVIFTYSNTLVVTPVQRDLNFQGIYPYKQMVQSPFHSWFWPLETSKSFLSIFYMILCYLYLNRLHFLSHTLKYTAKLAYARKEKS